jgi:hypothetical protein
MHCWDRDIILWIYWTTMRNLTSFTHNTQFFLFILIYLPSSTSYNFKDKFEISYLDYSLFFSFFLCFFFYLITSLTTYFITHVHSYTCVYTIILYSLYIQNSEFWFSFLLFFCVVVGSTNLKFRDKISSLFSIFSCLYFTFVHFVIWKE